jgi:hypothetical protein
MLVEAALSGVAHSSLLDGGRGGGGGGGGLPSPVLLVEAGGVKVAVDAALLRVLVALVAVGMASLLTSRQAGSAPGPGTAALLTSPAPPVSPVPPASPGSEVPPSPSTPRLDPGSSATIEFSGSAAQLRRPSRAEGSARRLSGSGERGAELATQNGGPMLGRSGSSGALNVAAQCAEYGISSDAYLNFFDGLEYKFEETAPYLQMDSLELQTFKEFRKEVRVKLAAATNIDRHLHYTLPDDSTILKFLQADKHNTTAAMKRILDTVAWRQKIRLNDIVCSRPEGLEAYRKLRARCLMGYAHSGHPVFAERVGEYVMALNTPNARSLSQDDHLRCYVYEMGQFIAAFRGSIKHGPPVYKQVFVCDCKSLKLLAAARGIKMLSFFARECDRHFVEMVEKIYLVNISSAVTSAWAAAKQVLDPSIVSKIEMSSGNGLEQLLKIMPKDQIFVEYGGDNPAPYPHVEALRDS